MGAPIYLCSECSGIDPSSVRRTDLSWRSAPPDRPHCALCEGMSPDCHVCPMCVSQHLDETHHGFGRGPAGAPRRLDGAGAPVRANHCFGCGGVQVIRGEWGQLSIDYYRRGRALPRQEPWECEKEDLEISSERIRTCEHRWETVLLTLGSAPREPDNQFADLLQSMPASLLGGRSIEDLSYSGSFAHCWCPICGNYRIVREGGRLPSVGDPRYHGASQPRAT